MRSFAILAFLAAPLRADLPQPVVTWPSGPLEVRLAFAKPIDADAAGALVGRSIDFAVGGEGVPKEDRFLGHLRIAAATPADEGRTLILATDPHPFPAAYAVPLTRAEIAGPGDLAVYNLGGVEASWDAGKDGDEPEATIWWPSLAPQAVRESTAGSVEHEHFARRLARPGRLTLRTQFAPPEGKGTLRLIANVPFKATLGNLDQESQETSARQQAIALPVEAAGLPDELIVTLPTGQPEPSLRVDYRAEKTGDAFTTKWLLLPWAPAPPVASDAPFEAPYPLDGGDAERGRVVFSSEEAKCAVCHKVGDRGGAVGPDLTEPRRRDLLWLYRSIAEPSAELHPEYVPYTIATNDGQVAVGTVRAEGADAIRVLDTEGRATTLKRGDLQLFQPGATSIMPVGLAGAIGEARMRDLLAFLRQRQ